MHSPTIATLASLPLYIEAVPPSEPFEPKGRPMIVYAHPSQRLVLQRERTADMGYGLHRSDQLAEQGISCGTLDSRAFAESLLEVLEPDLSIRMLQDLVAVFSQALVTQEAQRQESCRRYEALYGPEGTCSTEPTRPSASR